MISINNHKAQQHAVTDCIGCPCHWGAIQMGELIEGSCGECGCPKNEEGWEKYKAEHPDRIHEGLAPG